jgi:hypothetical protein
LPRLFGPGGGGLFRKRDHSPAQGAQRCSNLRKGDMPEGEDGTPHAALQITARAGL